MRSREEKLAAKRAHYKRNGARILARMREAYSVRRPAILSRVKRYRVANETKVKAAKADYRTRNKDVIAAKKRAEYLASRDKILAGRRASETVKQYMVRYRAENKLKMARRAKEYRSENAELLREKRAAAQPQRRTKKAFYQNRRKARKVAAEGAHTFAEWQLVCERWRRRCAYCGISASPLTQDHRTPLSRGGSDRIDNIVPACPPCNFSKGSRTAEEFLAWRREVEGVA